MNVIDEITYIRKNLIVSKKKIKVKGIKFFEEISGTILLFLKNISQSLIFLMQHINFVGFGL